MADRGGESALPGNGFDPINHCRRHVSILGHRHRDACAVELLLAEVSIEDIRVPLGHVNVLSKEHLFPPWQRSRRDRLARTVRDAHRRDPLLAELNADPAQEPGRECTGSPGPPPGPGDWIQFERASL